MNLTIITAVISAALGFGAAWQIQGHFLIKKDLEQANERISLQRATRAALERNTTAVIQAQNGAATRVAVIKRESDAVRTVSDSLRGDLDVIQRAAATSIDACNRHANTVSQLLVESATVNRELAQACDGHVSDLKTLMQAWPK